MLKRHAIPLLLVFLVACAASTRERTINATLAATDVAAASFVKLDHEKQTRIVMDSPDKASGERDLAAWRMKRNEIETGFAATYRSIAAAALVGDEPTLNAMVQAALLLSQSIKELEKL